MNKDLYLVRHGQTIFNLKRIIQGWSDSPLTQLGCEQAARAGMFLRARGIEPDHAYTSTLHRTEQTIASLWPGLAYERLDGLREWYFGDFEAERVPGNCSVLHFAFDDATDTFGLVEVFTQEDYARELGLEPLVAAAGPQRG